MIEVVRVDVLDDLIVHLLEKRRRDRRLTGEARERQHVRLHLAAEVRERAVPHAARRREPRDEITGRPWPLTCTLNAVGVNAAGFAGGAVSVVSGFGVADEQAASNASAASFMPAV